MHTLSYMHLVLINFSVIQIKTKKKKEEEIVIGTRILSHAFYE